MAGIATAPEVVQGAVGCKVGPWSETSTEASMGDAMEGCGAAGAVVVVVAAVAFSQWPLFFGRQLEHVNVYGNVHSSVLLNVYVNLRVNLYARALQ